jgi:hypothetical protein
MSRTSRSPRRPCPRRRRRAGGRCRSRGAWPGRRRWRGPSARGEVAAVEGVGILGGGEAGVLADGPRTRRRAGRPRTEGEKGSEGEGDGESGGGGRGMCVCLGVSTNLHVLRGVDGLHGDALGRLPDERLDRLPLEVLRTRGEGRGERRGADGVEAEEEAGRFFSSAVPAAATAAVPSCVRTSDASLAHCGGRDTAGSCVAKERARADDAADAEALRAAAAAVEARIICARAPAAVWCSDICARCCSKGSVRADGAVGELLRTVVTGETGSTPSLPRPATSRRSPSPSCPPCPSCRRPRLPRPLPPPLPRPPPGSCPRRRAPAS